MTGRHTFYRNFSELNAATECFFLFMNATLQNSRTFLLLEV